MINLFPALAEGESISAVMPLPEDESLWETHERLLRHRARQGPAQRARRLHLRARNGKIAMGLDEGDRLIGAEVCDDSHDIVLAAAGGRAIRFPVGARAGVQVAQLRGRQRHGPRPRATR